MSENEPVDPNKACSYYEERILEAQKKWEEMKKTVPDILKEIQRGKPIYTNAVLSMMLQFNDLSSSLQYLAKSPPSGAVGEDADQPAAEAPYVSPLQRFVAQFLQEYVEENHLDPSLLEGDCLVHHFNYKTIETVYSSDYERVNIPERLIEALPNITSVLHREVSNRDDLYDFFSPEVYDSDTDSTELEIELE